MCVFASPNGLLIFFGKNIQKMEIVKVLSTTANPGNRREFCVRSQNLRNIRRFFYFVLIISSSVFISSLLFHFFIFLRFFRFLTLLHFFVFFSFEFFFIFVFFLVFLFFFFFFFFCFSSFFLFLFFIFQSSEQTKKPEKNSSKSSFCLNDDFPL